MKTDIICKCICGADKEFCVDCMLKYIEKLEEYIDFLHETGKQDAIFCAFHGHGDSPKTITKAKNLRKELAKFKK